ncbi:MAG: hypothetical protein VX498_15470, partial [Myxococcota bacterium]|nr:hypothetical protein [Myxococcota bacterium]
VSAFPVPMTATSLEAEVGRVLGSERRSSREARERLSHLLLVPITTRLRAVTQLLWVPDEALGTLGIDLLPLADGQALGDTIQVLTFPSLEHAEELRGRGVQSAKGIRGLASNRLEEELESASGRGLHFRLPCRVGRGGGAEILLELPGSPGGEEGQTALEDSVGADGILSPPEILRLDSSGTLVILPVCGSGSASPVGRSVLLQDQAFIDGGAAALIRQTWTVPEAASKRFDEVLEAELSGGADIPTAFAAARAGVRKRWKRSKVWAAWRLTTAPLSP